MSSSKNLLIKRFNNLLFDFFKEIIEIYPNIKIFNSMRVQLRMGLMSNEKLAIEPFYNFLVKINKTEIISKNENFFLNFDLSNTSLADLNYLKNIWLNASNKTKNAIWKYLQVLTILSEKVMN